MKILVTAYCACRLCCGESSPQAGGLGLTASGTRPVEGVTIAAPRRVPLGTWIVLSVPGERPRRLRVEDRTSRRLDGKRWDVFMHDHGKAERFGVKQGTVRIERKP